MLQSEFETSLGSLNKARSQNEKRELRMWLSVTSLSGFKVTEGELWEILQVFK